MKNILRPDNEASCYEYLHELLSVAVTIHGTPTKSLDEILLEKALSYGMSKEAAEVDVRHILNIRTAVSVLLKEAASERTNTEKRTPNA